MLKEEGEEGGRGNKEKESLIESLLKWRGSSSHVFFLFQKWQATHCISILTITVTFSICERSNHVQNSKESFFHANAILIIHSNNVGEKLYGYFLPCLTYNRLQHFQ